MLCSFTEFFFLFGRNFYAICLLISCLFCGASVTFLRLWDAQYGLTLKTTWPSNIAELAAVASQTTTTFYQVILYWKYFWTLLLVFSINYVYCDSSVHGFFLIELVCIVVLWWLGMILIFKAISIYRISLSTFCINVLVYVWKKKQKTSLCVKKKQKIWKSQLLH